MKSLVEGLSRDGSAVKFQPVVCDFGLFMEGVLLLLIINRWMSLGNERSYFLVTHFTKVNKEQLAEYKLFQY